jgi:hypothetical protein
VLDQQLFDFGRFQRWALAENSCLHRFFPSPSGRECTTMATELGGVKPGLRVTLLVEEERSSKPEFRTSNGRAFPSLPGSRIVVAKSVWLLTTGRSVPCRPDECQDYPTNSHNASDTLAACLHRGSQSQV